MPWRRKLFHFSGILIPILHVGAGVPRRWVLGILTAMTAGFFLVDLLRAFMPTLQERFRTLLKAILDPKDMQGLNGTTLYFSGMTLAVWLFPDPAVSMSGVLALAVGDPAAALVGSSVKSPRWGRVSLAGSAACFVGATAGAAVFQPFARALMAGAAATLLEAFSGSKLDNLVIPVGVAACLRLL
ncbi:MAG: hypothetical protein O7C98_16765 [Planctomycetota bacterium]|nr:hypothetical protein [Planctomycetota bacterium]